MKTLFTLTTIVLILITTLVSIVLFQHEKYDMSAVLFVTSFVSTAFWIYVVANKKVVLQ